MTVRLFHRISVFLAAAVICTLFGAQAVHAQLGLQDLVAQQAAAPVSVTAQFAPATPQQPSRLFITAKIADGWHIFSITQPKGGPIKTTLKLAADQPAKLKDDFRPIKPADKHPEPLFDNLIVETHEKEVTWYAPLEWTGAEAGATLAGEINFQACSDSNCLPPTTVKFAAQAGAGVPVTSLEPRVEAGEAPRAATAATYRDSGSHVTLRGEVKPASVQPSSKAVLQIVAEPIEGYHLYELKEETTKIGNKPVLFRLVNVGSLVATKFTASAEPKAKPSPDGGEAPLKVYNSPVTWTVEFDVPADAKPGKQTLEGLIGFQTCLGDQKCDLPRAARFTADVQVGPMQPAGAPLHFVSAKYPEVVAVANNLPAVTFPSAADAKPAGVVAQTSQTTLPVVLASAFLGGLLLNLMPCVLPVIGLKIFSFMEQAGESRRTALMLNLWYSAGLLAVFLVLATAASAATLGLAKTNLGWGEQFASTPFNITMASVVFVMALSFLGVWEIPIPGFAGSGKTQDLASREGAFGAFTKGAVTTLLATPCSGPFLGSVFGFTLSQPPAITYLIFTFIGVGMSSPYLLIGAFPELIKFLPKPGAWMETFKQAMGFMLLGGVVFVFTYLKAVYVVPTFALLVGLWAGCWWIGRTPLYEATAKIIRAYAIGGAVAAIVGVLSFQMLVPGEQLLPWQPYSEARLAELTSQGKTVMVDFTAEWCLTCKYNLKTAINRRDVASAIEAGRVVPLLADWTDGSEEIKDSLAKLGSNSIPVVAIYPATRSSQPIILRDVITQQQLLDALKEAGPSQVGKNAAR